MEKEPGLKEQIEGLGSMIGCCAAVAALAGLAWAAVSALRWAWDNPLFR